MENGSHEQEVEGGQVFDLAMSVVFAIVAAGFAARGIQLIEEHAPDAVGAAAGLGFAAVLLTSVSIASAYRFNGPRD